MVEMCETPLFYEGFGGMANFKPNLICQNYMISGTLRTNHIIPLHSRKPFDYRCFRTGIIFNNRPNHIIQKP